jgi:ribosome-associated protein
VTAPADGGAPRGPLHAAPGITIPVEELEITYVRSPGPGGQKANKTATCAQLRYCAARSPSLPEPVRQRLLALAGTRLTAEGEIVIRAHRHRSREQNRADALARLAHLIAKAARPEKKRTQTKPTRASKERRITAKKQAGQKKRLRGRVTGGD